MLPETNAYVKSYDGQTKWIYLLIKEDNLFKKCNTICDKVSADLSKVYNKIVWKTKIKSHGNEVTDFFDEKISKVDPNHTCLAVISLERWKLSASAFKRV